MTASRILEDDPLYRLAHIRSSIHVHWHGALFRNQLWDLVALSTKDFISRRKMTRSYFLTTHPIQYCTGRLMIKSISIVTACIRICAPVAKGTEENIKN